METSIKRGLVQVGVHAHTHTAAIWYWMSCTGCTGDRLPLLLPVLPVLPVLLLPLLLLPVPLPVLLHKAVRKF